MPLFAILSHYDPAAADRRASARPAHRDYVRDHGQPIRIAGQLVDAGGAVAGAIVVLEVDSRDAAVAWAENDPYALAGSFGALQVLEWQIGMGGLA
ncbi:MAG TPA: YciI family protein [Novosphingobium sp.]|nr:YciI family protein [Novosphingobium sp.]